MSRLKIIFMFFFVGLNLLLFGQNIDQLTMRSFIPKSNAYDIYYPLNFKLVEHEDALVTIGDSVSKMNITISYYQFEKKLKTEDLIDIMNGFLNESYKKELKREDWNSYKSKFDNLIELKTRFDNSNWVWYGVNVKKKLLVLSINKDQIIDKTEIDLLRFMIDNLIIN